LLGFFLTCDAAELSAPVGPIASLEGVSLALGQDFTAAAESVVLGAGHQVSAQRVRVESTLGNGLVIQAPQGRLDAQGRLLVLEGGVEVRGADVAIRSREVSLQYDSSNRLVGIEARGEVQAAGAYSGDGEEMAPVWTATGEMASVDWLLGVVQLQGNARLTERSMVLLGGVVEIPLDGKEPTCKGCEALGALGTE